MNVLSTRSIAFIALGSSFLVFGVVVSVHKVYGTPQSPTLQTKQGEPGVNSVKANATNKTEEAAELVAIRKTLNDYIEGSTQGQPERLSKAFHEKLNLYSIKEGQLKVWAGTDYIAGTKQGSSTGEQGRILSIDFENDIAVSKVEIKQPRRQAYIDYFMLLKIGDDWKIVHKMYTKQNGRTGRVEFKESRNVEGSSKRNSDSKSKN